MSTENRRTIMEMTEAELVALYPPTESRLLTVAQYVALLQAMPQDAIVLVNGYEAGLDAAYPPRIVVADGPWEEGPAYFGEFESVDAPNCLPPGLPRRQAVVISRSDVH